MIKRRQVVETVENYFIFLQDDWRYYDMVWVQDYDNKEGDCTVLVDNTVETVNCNFLLPTLCEYDKVISRI